MTAPPRALIVGDQHDGAAVAHAAPPRPLRGWPGRGCSSARRATARWLETTSLARANRVFSPPDSVRVGCSTVSPENRKLPSTRRDSTSASVGADDRIVASAVASGSSVRALRVVAELEAVPARTSPVSAVSTPARVRSNVVLPAPFKPRMTTRLPLSMAGRRREYLQRAVRLR